MMSNEVEEYLSIDRVEVNGSCQPDNCNQTDAECGLKLCVKIPQISDAYLHDLKDDIKQIVRGENSSGHGMNGNKSMISNGSEIKHTLHLTDVPGDPTYQIARVTLHGEVEKAHYEIMRAIQCKLKKVSDSQVDSVQSDQRKTLKSLTILFPSNVYKYVKRQSDIDGLYKVILTGLAHDGIDSYTLNVRDNGGSSPPTVRAYACFYKTSVSDDHPLMICKRIEFILEQWNPTKMNLQVSCELSCLMEHTQDLSEGKISYALTHSARTSMMSVTYPDRLLAGHHTADTWSERFHQSILEAVSKMNLGAARRRLWKFDKHDGGAVENGRDSDYHIEDNVPVQHKDGYKRAHVCIDPTTSKEEIACAVLHQIKQQRNSQIKVD